MFQHRRSCGVGYFLYINHHGIWRFGTLVALISCGAFGVYSVDCTCWVPRGVKEVSWLVLACLTFYPIVSFFICTFADGLLAASRVRKSKATIGQKKICGQGEWRSWPVLACFHFVSWLSTLCRYIPEVGGARWLCLTHKEEKGFSELGTLCAPDCFRLPNCNIIWAIGFQF